MDPSCGRLVLHSLCAGPFTALPRADAPKDDVQKEMQKEMGAWFAQSAGTHGSSGHAARHGAPPLLTALAADYPKLLGAALAKLQLDAYAVGCGPTLHRAPRAVLDGEPARVRDGRGAAGGGTGGGGKARPLRQRATHRAVFAVMVALV